MGAGAAPTGAMWGGRFAGGPDALFRAVNDSLSVDWRLVQHDIVGSIAWAHALAGAGVLSDEEADRLRDHLIAIGEEASGLSIPPIDSGAEDVHTWVEQRLIASAGSLGKKLHTGRSRNDQVATDLRLWTRDAIDHRLVELHDVRRGLLDLAERELDTALPGYTHLQRAQPILLPHWCLAYDQMLQRDGQRLSQARARANICPLGCGALAGTAYPIDRMALARALGFDAPSQNSLDSVADRDFVIESLAALSLMSIHLSRLAEEMILYVTEEFGFFHLDDAVASGSSLMPQKKNPDALELIRAKAGRAVAEHVAMLVAVKGLPLAYNKDLQEDKRSLFCSMDDASLCLRVLPRILDTLRVRRERCREAAQAGHANATDLADSLVARGIPFRDAHEISGRVVRTALERGAPIESLPMDSLKPICSEIDQTMLDGLTIEACLDRRAALGGTAPARVREALAAARRQWEGGPGA
ncbi:MAG: argininosuccinate lyase [Phycisphaeraceae bacterium]|nr:argininosuccinate lyase [Phycisphaeraceae bacterium]